MRIITLVYQGGAGRNNKQDLWVPNNKVRRDANNYPSIRAARINKRVREVLNALFHSWTKKENNYLNISRRSSKE